jgi:hypothetical protein
MDLLSFINDNSTAFIALIGVILGSICTAIITFFTQRYQNRWIRESQDREWIREHRQEKLGQILEWLNRWLRSASKALTVEKLFYEVKKSGRQIGKKEVEVITESLKNSDELLRDISPTIKPLINSFGDMELKVLYRKFISTISSYSSVLDSNNIQKTIEDNKRIITEVEDIVTETQKRVNYLVENPFVKV